MSPFSEQNISKAKEDPMKRKLEVKSTKGMYISTPSDFGQLPFLYVPADFAASLGWQEILQKFRDVSGSLPAHHERLDQHWWIIELSGLDENQIQQFVNELEGNVKGA